MKRAGNLFQQITEISNLELAFWKAQRGKAGKREVQEFRKSLQENLLEMRESMLSGDFKIGNYHYFTVYDPKERTICAANFRERVMQHAVINICDPVFERYQIYDSYACRKGKGLDACLERARYFSRSFPWYLKLDIHKFFDSISHAILLQMLDRRFKDARLMDYFSRLIDTYSVEAEHGIPIGNLTSQYFANLYLGALDHEIKDVLRVPGYVRYMDDFVLFGESGKSLLATLEKVENFVNNNLCLTLNTPVCNRTGMGLPFLSYRIYSNGLRLSLKAKRKFKNKFREIDATEDGDRAQALLAFVQRADSYGFRWKEIYGK